MLAGCAWQVEALLHQLNVSEARRMRAVRRYGKLRDWCAGTGFECSFARDAEDGNEDGDEDGDEDDEEEEEDGNGDGDGENKVDKVDEGNEGRREVEDCEGETNGNVKGR